MAPLKRRSPLDAAHRRKSSIRRYTARQAQRLAPQPPPWVCCLRSACDRAPKHPWRSGRTTSGRLGLCSASASRMVSWSRLNRSATDSEIPYGSGGYGDMWQVSVLPMQIQGEFETELRDVSVARNALSLARIRDLEPKTWYYGRRCAGVEPGRECRGRAKCSA